MQVGSILCTTRFTTPMIAVYSGMLLFQIHETLDQPKFSVSISLSMQLFAAAGGIGLEFALPQLSLKNQGCETPTGKDFEAFT